MRAQPSDRIGKRPRKRAGKKRKSGPGPLKKAIRTILAVTIAFLVASLLVVLPLRWVSPATSSFMLQDNSGRIPVAYEWVAWEDIGSAAALAVVASEDQKFASHFGFDLKSIRESVEDYSDGAPLRGASSISQQVAKNMYLWSGKSFLRKGVEAYFTILIEMTWPKKRILEIYLNIAELGPGIYGVGAAADAYFRKTPDQLSDAEVALFAAVLPNPIQLSVDDPSPYVRERQNWILTQMKRLHREQWLLSLE